MRWFLRVGAALLLTLGLVATAFAAPPASSSGGTTAATAAPLPRSLNASGSLMGSTTGSFAYYSFDYAGDGSTGTLTLTISPTDPTTTNAVGVNVYQAGNTLLSMNTVSPTPGTNLGLFSSTTAGPILVQVYNYLAGATASYSFDITGANAQTSTTTATAPTTSAPAPAPAPEAAGSGGTTAATAVALPKSLTASGRLTGSTTGSFAYYSFDYAGDGSTGTLTLTISPTDPTTTNAVGVNVYQAGTSLLSMNTASPTPGTNLGLFSSTTRGPILVQVYNYLSGQAVSYNLSITGANQ